MKYQFFLILFLSPIVLGQMPVKKFIIWNIGQGQWTSLVQEGECQHFDAGGEFFPLKNILATCHSIQEFHLSHWDHDHINGLYRIFQSPQICMHLPLINKKLSPRKQLLINKFKQCNNKDSFVIYRPRLHSSMSTNATSTVFQISNQILIPGDSPVSEERKWIPSIKSPQQVRILILGHHGSRTSTSLELLDALPNLKLAVSSARIKRFGHPHIEVLQKLKAKKIPILRTEEWGNIGFELNF